MLSSLLLSMFFDYIRQLVPDGPYLNHLFWFILLYFFILGRPPRQHRGHHNKRPKRHRCRCLLAIGDNTLVCTCLGYNTGKGKTAVFSMWVTRLQVRCDFLSPMATPYPLPRYHRLKRVFQLYNGMKKFRSRIFFSDLRHYQTAK